ncbi:hypothetical protein GON01_08660 [Sphingomonas sp. MAH-20]|uniref:Imidazole glycerol phosphate synthase subunit HisF n=1 Tax=Sphingomonas horti TaxID=2682842 RepID=A0A6I4J1M7_9SPHN|nr:hypothetical protein [Sphingomonas horti]
MPVIRKRIIGVITVKNGWAVQSIGYRRYLPLGRPEILAENLDRWGADEILLQCIDRSAHGLGPDLSLLDRVGRLGLSTPLIYAGGIRTAQDAITVVATAADRVLVDSMLWDDPDEIGRSGEYLGNQAIIASLPLSIEGHEVRWLNYRTGISAPFSDRLLKDLAAGTISEALVIDWRHEGQPLRFDAALLDALPCDVPLIAFGGLSDAAQLSNILRSPRVAAVAIGNFLSYREHALQAFKQNLVGLPIRPATYQQSSDFCAP